MFKENFIRLCNERGEFPSVVCKQVGITPAAFSKWTDESVPRRATLMRIADYFGVTVDDLLADSAPTPIDEAINKLTASMQGALDAMEKEKKPLLGLNPKLSALINSMDQDELEDLERYAEFVLSRKKGN